jgi:hypothetical protein
VARLPETAHNPADRADGNRKSAVPAAHRHSVGRRHPSVGTMINLFKITLCKLGKHRWTAWREDNPCERSRVCIVCAVRKGRTNHSWGTWQEEDSETHARICARCRSKESRLHNWTSVHCTSGTQGIEVWGRQCNMCERSETESKEHGL